MPVLFTDVDVAKRYESMVEVDLEIMRAGVYKGRLSNITWAMARKMVRSGSNLIKPKQKEKEPIPEIKNDQPPEMNTY